MSSATKGRALRGNGPGRTSVAVRIRPTPIHQYSTRRPPTTNKPTAAARRTNDLHSPCHSIATAAANAKVAGPLFGNAAEPDDIESGTLYVLRSLSKPPFVSEHRTLIHKIGVTGGRVETRIADAENDATYLLAPVEIVAEYKLHNLSRTKMESIFHRVFNAVQLDLTIEDRFGKPVKPREWFVVPVHVIDEAVERIRDGSITQFLYDAKTAKLTRNAVDS